jgi:hypothetical protein
MPVRYQHTQRGTLMLVVLPIAALACATAAVLTPTLSRWIDVMLALLLARLTWQFSALTVIVDGEELRWYFGPQSRAGKAYNLALADVASVSIVRNSVFNGFGIRRRSGYRLYNVSGLDAVELRLKNGEVRRIGTDDPSGLAAALGA